MDPSRADFCHPYQPYDIQLQFMSDLYRCIEESKVGIFESPTGTGKSLSLICGALTWLRDHKSRSLDFAVQQSDQDDGTPDWMKKAEEDERRRHLLQQRQELEAKLASIRREEARRSARTTSVPVSKRLKTTHPVKSVQDDESEDQFLLADYNSDTDIQNDSNHAEQRYSAKTQDLLNTLKTNPTNEDMPDEEDEIKIIFCSRTHSQLTQFVNELRRVQPPPSMPKLPDIQEMDVPEGEIVKHLSLGSRKNLCINPNVRALGFANSINDKCLELQKPGTPTNHRCSFLPTKDSKSKIDDFRNRALAHVQDIEDIGKLGEALEICPYYASRSAIASSEIVTLPYPLLLQKSAREATGISLKGNVIVIDEAHNLMDAIAGLHSVAMTLKQLDTATSQVRMYAQRFLKKLKGKNRVYVAQVVRLLASITSCLQNTTGNKKHSEQIVTATQLMAGEGCDQIKPHQLIKYIQESKLAHKVEGYLEARQEGDSQAHNGILATLQHFLTVLMNPASEGRFFVRVDQEGISVRYALLDPREHFRDIVENARAIILAGGTMSPMSDYADYLFSYVEPTRLQNFSFGHVIPSTNLIAQAVGWGPSDEQLEFNYANRARNSLVLELLLLLKRVCSIVPDGVVVFFPSYDYLTHVVMTWSQLSDGTDSLAKIKPVFIEARNGGVEDLLKAYTQAIDAGTGAVLLSVVGGKLSEGINFSDKLGRAVVSVGLPFPNANAAEWKAKIQHVEYTRQMAAITEGKSEQEAKALGGSAGRDFYENACMRAVNQCIGRAIRHKNDYAAILLVDRRFSTERIEKKLPGWIMSSMDRGKPPKAWSQIEAGLKRFFAEKV